MSRRRVKKPVVACSACGTPYTDRGRERDNRVQCERCYLDVGPFLAWLRGYVRVHGGNRAAALRLGVTAWNLERHLKCLTDYVHVDTADRLFCAAGEPEMLRELYGSWYDDDERESA
ncbi:MAG TPA: hypothetical protein VNJ54_15200 [Plantibacter sp.]|uniref:hypothetical protein n=1 Tax=Plantibacter sp. TaxID=1871045 RepID=UPI002C5512B5|nr:hypothetical protein [Plantibacter sp.]